MSRSEREPQEGPSQAELGTGSSRHFSTLVTHAATAETFIEGLSVGTTSLDVVVFGAGFAAILVTLPWVATSQPLLFAGIAASIVLALGVLGMRRRTARNDERARTRGMLVVLVSVSALPLVYVYGVHGPVTAVVGLALLMFNMIAPVRFGIAASLVLTLPHVGVQLLEAFGALVPRGSLSLRPYLVGELVSVLGVVLIYGLATLLGQLFRRRTLEEWEKLAAIGKEVAAREALLREARLDLERAAAVGQPGRFTDQQLGSFVLGTLLGRGGMGEIYDAIHVETGAPAAVKLLRAPVGDADALLRRFLREADIVAQLDAPQIPKVYEVGGLDAALPFVAMERLRGADLGQVLRDQIELSPLDVADLIDDAASALEVARKSGIVHRDIKPSNLFRTDSGWKVLDFGVARLIDGSSSLTGTRIVGTPGYMAPEQMDASGQVDHRSDVYSLTLAAYRALTGKPAFSHDDLGTLMQMVLAELPVRPSSLVEVPEQVDSVMRIGMAKAQTDRFDSARELAAAFRQALHGELDARTLRRARQLDAILTWKEPYRGLPRGLT